MLRDLAVVGGILVTLGLLIVLGAWGGLDERMPLQVLPKRLAVYPIAVGAGLLLIAGVAAAFP
jgi:hypothetical protein